MYFTMYYVFLLLCRGYAEVNVMKTLPLVSMCKLTATQFCASSVVLSLMAFIFLAATETSGSRGGEESKLGRNT